MINASVTPSPDAPPRASRVRDDSRDPPRVSSESRLELRARESREGCDVDDGSLDR